MDLRPYTHNPFYWQIDGTPTVLLGGSFQDNPFQWVGVDHEFLCGHLDTLVSVGGNYIRNTPTVRNVACPEWSDAGMAYPFLEVAPGKFNLTRFNEEPGRDSFFGRLDAFLAETRRRGIVVQQELWDGFGIAAPWEKEPWNPDNNVNYTWAEVSSIIRPDDYGGIYDASVIDPANPLSRARQRYVDRLLDTTLTYDHVLYQVGNELGLAWEASEYWTRFVLNRAARAGRQVYMCDQRRYHKSPFDHVRDEAKSQDFEQADNLYPVEHPDVFGFLDFSQNGGNVGDRHYENLQRYRNRLKRMGGRAVRPINHTKTYAMIWQFDSTGYNRPVPTCYEDECFLSQNRFWCSIFGGAAAVRFHRDTLSHAQKTRPGALFGIGLRPEAQRHIRSMRMLLTDRAGIDITRMEACPALVVGAREPNEAFALAEPGRQYAVYFPGGDIRVHNRNAYERVACDNTIRIRLPRGTYRERWLDINRSQWIERGECPGGTRTLAVPAGEPWAAVLRPVGPRRPE
ncbi:MAG: hypothetical protein JXR37_20665 [Kiritimatiellae bacterium]|nr:hypothetical protein [Kiritimatiellia bacterium]